jgi:hypothetical protein
VTSEPRRSRPDISGYGIPERDEGLLPFSHVEATLRDCRNYWLATVRPDGRPHSVPVWGVWVGGRLHFGGGGRTRKARNLAANPSAVIHTESADVVVILEGVAQEVTDAEHQRTIDDAYEAKYGIRHGTPVWELRPRVAFGWTEYPATVTRWTFPTEEQAGSGS